MLRALARRHLPEEVWGRPKHGFSVPLRHNFNGPWRELGEHVVGPRRRDRAVPARGRV
jgi:hypothetical protein